MDTSVISDEQVHVLLSHAEKTEQQGHPAAESLEAARRSGAFAMRTPAAYGGEEADAGTVARRLAALGRACPATAWIAGTCMTAKLFARVAFDDAVQSEYFADPDALACGSGVPAGRGEPVRGGVRVTGRWPNVSGCEDAVWAGVALMCGETYSLALIPVEDLAIERTWHMAGMRGTGSHTLVATDLVVPAGRVAAMSPPTVAERLLFGITVLGPVVGAARGALDTVNTMFASDRKPFMTAYSRMGESPGARQWLAEATYLVDRAERTMLTVARAAASQETTAPDTARSAMDLADAGRDCRAAVERMLDLHGASGFDSANPLQRYWRDVSVGSRHPHLNPYLATENLGSALAGTR